jgi:hypothetical protein
VYRSVFLPPTSVWKLVLNRPESVGCSAFGVQAATKRAETAHNAKFFMVDISIIIN